MKRIKLLILILTILLVNDSLVAQIKNESGQYTLGVRSTSSLFTDAGSPGSGIGGMFRIRMGKRINTEWFADYLTTNLQNLGYRRDGHIGWSVLFYLSKEPMQAKKLSPFLIAGHCFDYTKVYVLADKKSEDRWSSAVQMGFGTHYNVTEKFDISLTAQYMSHLGADLHSHIEEENGVKKLEIEKHGSAGLEGHLLLTLSLNYRLGNLWRTKQ